ncbi:MAG TPA: MFS transporter, partial [Micropepsaceae bacterium]|nr:MFS transporter [Micropepsaceae bacterium]
FLIAALGVATRQYWLVVLGYGGVGGIGLGIGYISPVSTLIKWFPDRRGMATGMAIMGFGGGAMIGAPLANLLMNSFKTPDSVGVWQTFLAMAAIYFVFMIGGAFGYRLPPPGWAPHGWTPQAAKAMIVAKQVHLHDAHKTKQFWLIWAVLCLNVSAGIGVIGIASPMLQEIFGGSLIGRPDVPFTALDATQGQAVAAIAAGFTGLLSLFNIGGRFFWASLSDLIGRKTTYYTFFALGILLYASAPWAAHAGSTALFVLAICIILSMYGGGFATIPAYLADIFGTQFVGAIHGRLLTAWSTAGIVGPVVVNYIREFEIAAGVPRQSVYDVTLYILAGFLVIGFLCNWAVKPLKETQQITWLVQRMNRRPYILFWLPIWTVLLLLYLTNSIPSTSALGALLFIVIPVVQTITAIKRLHDMNLAGWFALLIYVPFINIVFLLALFLIPGTAGPNRFDHARWFMSEEEVAALQAAPAAKTHSPKPESLKAEAGASLPLAWVAVGIPIAWGVWVTLKSALVLF